jgi:plastocyanin
MRKLQLGEYIIIVTIILITAQMNEVYAQGTQLSVIPASTTLQDIGLSFHVNITVSQVADLAGWEFKLYYPNWLLNGSNITEGPFLKTAGETAFLKVSFTDSYNATHGLVWAACSLYYQGPGASGSGTLATITFKTVSGGDGILHLADTDLIDSQMPSNHIPHSTNDGSVHVLVGIKDVAVKNIMFKKTVIGINYTYSSVKVTVKNEGSYGVSFDLSLNATQLLVGTISYSLFGSTSSGWGFTRDSMTSPGPTITVHKGDTIQLTLTSADAKIHNFFVDYDGDTMPSTGEPKSKDTCVPPYYDSTINCQFTANRTGTFTYYSQYDENVMYGTIVIQAPPTSTKEIGRQPVLLISGASKNVTFIWNTHDYLKGFYNLTAYAWPLQGETDISDNLLSCGTIKVTILGDINGDFKVDIKDVSLVGVNWQKTAPPAPPNVDINDDGKIDIKDVSIIGAHWQKDP